MRCKGNCAGVAQLVEQLICNQQVGGSNPSTSSNATTYGGIPERPKGADCKSVVTDFGGPNPPSPTTKDTQMSVFFVLWRGVVLDSDTLFACENVVRSFACKQVCLQVKRKAKASHRENPPKHSYECLFCFVVGGGA